MNITFKPISVSKFIEFGLFGDPIFDIIRNITFTEDNASNALKWFFHILFYICAHLGMPNLKVGLFYSSLETFHTFWDTPVHACKSSLFQACCLLLLDFIGKVC